jgi:hypothetical protein
MGNVVEIEKLAGSDELDELYRLDASESEPEDEPEDEDEDEAEEGAEPGGMPHPIKPEGMPHP